MKTLTISADPGRSSLPDVLTEDEERALVLIRDAVEGIRERGIVDDRAALGSVLEASGVQRIHDGVKGEIDAFTCRGARFTLRSGPRAGGGIEVNFIFRHE